MINDSTIRAKLHVYFDESLQYIADSTNSTKNHIFHQAIICFCRWKLSGLEDKIVIKSEELKKMHKLLSYEEDVDLSTAEEVKHLKKINKSWIGKQNPTREGHGSVDIEAHIPKALHELMLFIAKSLERDEERCINEAIFNYVLEKIEDFEDCEKLAD